MEKQGGRIRSQNRSGRHGFGPESRALIGPPPLEALEPRLRPGLISWMLLLA